MSGSRNGLFTPTEQRMLRVLSDGLLHRIQELHACLEDELGPVTNVHSHLSHMRRILRDKGEDIVARHGVVEGVRSIYYQQVRLISNK